MRIRFVLLVLLGLILLAAAADLAWHLPRLPERLATHFNGGGRPDGWTSRSNFALTQAGILLLVPSVFVGLAFLVPRLPSTLVNLPHRDYWLSPERRQYTMEIISRFLLVLALVVTVFLVMLMHLVLRANLAPSPRLGGGLMVLVVTELGVMLGAVVWLLWRFRRPRGGRK